MDLREKRLDSRITNTIPSAIVVAPNVTVQAGPYLEMSPFAFNSTV